MSAAIADAMPECHCVRLTGADRLNSTSTTTVHTSDISGTHMNQAATTMDHASVRPKGLGRRLLSDLPFDCISHIASFLRAAEAARLLSTCRKLASYLYEESIWRPYCLDYGVGDVSFFPRRSFHYVYTRLLHRYGNLLGLWAGDAPYRGSVLEFRMVQGPEWAGIVGYVWKFPPPQEALSDWEDEEGDNIERRVLGPTTRIMEQDQLLIMWNIIRHPRLYRIFTVGFQSTSATAHDDDIVRVQCSSVPTFLAPGPSHEQSTHSADMEVVMRSRQGYCLAHLSGRGKSMHPDFPPAPLDARWYDGDRCLPRVRAVENAPITRGMFVHRMTFGLYPEATDREAPPAIVIKCTDHRCHKHHQELPFRDDMPLDPQYFPLEPHIQEGVEPWSDNWTPESLVGLWLGAFGPHGTEILWVDCVVVNGQQTVRASKITGDVNVPRGVLTWGFNVFDSADFTLEANPNSSFGYWIRTVVPDLRGCRCFVGEGQTSSHGFIVGMQEMSGLEIAVVGADEIKIAWLGLQHAFTYQRYKGRRIIISAADSTEGEAD